MLDGLTSVLTAVVYNAVAIYKSQLGSYLGNSLEHVGNLDTVLCGDFISTADMVLRNHENVHGSLGIYILEGVNVFILLYF